MYIVLVGLRSIAWAEYKFIFSSSPTETEDINGRIRTLLTEAIEYTDNVMTKLVEKVDNRFGELEERWSCRRVTDSNEIRCIKSFNYLLDSQYRRPQLPLLMYLALVTVMID